MSTIQDWREIGQTHAREGKPCTPPPHGPIGQAYRAGYDEAKEPEMSMKTPEQIAAELVATIRERGTIEFMGGLEYAPNDLWRKIAAEAVKIDRAQRDPNEDDRECSRCFDEVQTLSTDDLCDGCVEELETTTECPNCGERVPHDDMCHWPNLKEPISMCGLCEYNARRSGWEPGA